MEKITFDDIAGYEDEKERAMKYVGWLKNYKKYKEEGAYLPKGLLLCGEPGVGKTMFAKAIANESKAYFVEAKLCGVDKLTNTIGYFQSAFDEAKEHTPSILFIDEIDQLLGEDASGMKSDERRRLVDFLLQQLDGISSTEGIFVMATCNRRGALPDALLRSGRMDNHIRFPLPNKKNREKIFDLYLSKSERFRNISRKNLSTISVGLHCADIKSVCNKVLIKCIDEEKKYASMKDFEQVIPEVLARDITRTKTAKDRQSDVIYHELSHFAVLYHYIHDGCVINVDGLGSCSGYVQKIADGNDSFESNIQQIDVFLAGKVGELLFCNKISIGSRVDLEHASSTYQYLSQALGCMGWDYFELYGEMNNYRESGTFEKSESYRKRREEGQVKFLTEREEVVRKILEEERPLVEYFYPILKKKGSLSYRSVKYYLGRYETTKKEAA